MRPAEEPYNGGMKSEQSGLVDIARDLLRACQLTRQLTARYRASELRFEDVKELVGDAEDSVLFRLKEHCHALFRPAEGATGEMVRPETLFDLAVGSLFHVAMKLRENLYQQEVYGPKVRALREVAASEAGDAVRGKVVREMEKVLAAAAQRLEEAVHETEVLLVETRDLFRILLTEHRENGLVARYLVENAALLEEVFDEGLEALLEEIYGDAAEGYAVVGRSYLRSGYFDEGRCALGEALARCDRPDLRRLCAYADGMSAYLSGRYGETLEHLAAWLAAAPGDDEVAYADLAHAALQRIGQQRGAGAEALVAEARKLAERIRPAH